MGPEGWRPTRIRVPGGLPNNNQVVSTNVGFVLLQEIPTGNNVVSKKVVVQTGSRLHFGLISPGEFRGRRFGGAGLMIETPQTELAISPADALHIQVDPPRRDWIEGLVQRWHETVRGLELPNAGVPASFDRLPVRIRLDSSIGRHLGLGSGTQTALAVAAGLFAALELPQPPVGRLAALMDRGHRSAIGSHGFEEGGFLVDRGKGPGEAIATRDVRLEFPSRWPVILVLPRGDRGMHGPEERKAFAAVRASDATLSERMLEALSNGIVAGIATEDHELFSAALHEFNYCSGLHFAAAQGGPWNGSRLEETVHAFRDAGIEAVGQSSWGPCIFGIARDDEHATEAIAAVKGRLDDIWSNTGYRIEVTRARNQGARILEIDRHSTNDASWDAVLGEHQA